MADSEQRLLIYSNGTLVDPTSVLTGSVDDSYGIQRIDTYVSVVAIGQAYTKLSQGFYRYVFTEPAVNLTYRFAAKILHQGVTYYVTGDMPAGISQLTVVLPNLDYYSSQAEVLRILGSMAESLLLEDTSSKGLVWTDLLEDADETIKMYVLQHYDTSALNSNKWIRRRATILLANLLTNRRGSPPIFSSRVDRVYEELNMIRDGRMHIPGATVRSFQGPVVRNYMMQNRFWMHPLRVESSKSTNSGSYAGEDLAIEPYIYYSVV